MPEPFKNFISPAVVRTLGKHVLAAYPHFAYKRFEKTCLAQLDALELKDRAIMIGETLWSELPADPATAIDTLTRAIQPIPVLKVDDSFDGWLFMPLNSLLTAHGLEAVEASLKLIPEITKRFTAEFGIRVFLIQKPQKILPHLKRWAKDPDHNLRRLVSEGTRPRLPWGEQIPAFIADPAPIFPLLELLKDDPSEYVRRSVANNLNDISKDHPELMLDRVETWLADATPHRKRLLKHACRTLVKQGHPRCLQLLGFPKPKLEAIHFAANPTKIALGEKLTLTVDLRSTATRDQDLIVDYRFHLVKANGKTAPKVFKGSSLTLPAKKTKTLRKQFHLKPISTRKYYTGTNSIELLVNGIAIATTTFHLQV